MIRLIRVAQWLALLVPAALVLALVLRYGVNVPYADQWTLVTPLARMETGTFRWTEIFAQHNEHRMVFPKLVMLPLARLTHWNVRAELLASIAFALGSLLLLAALARPSLRDSSPPVRIWALFAMSALLFSLSQWENWLWGWQLQWFLAVFAAVSAVALATWSLRNARSWACVAGAAGATVVCQFSLASGVALWPAIAVILAFHPRRRLVLSVWFAAGLVTTAAYLIGYTRPPHHPSVLAVFEHPLTFLLYLGNYLSGPIGREAPIGFAAAAAFAVAGGVAVAGNRRNPELVVPWIALGAFAGANAILTGIGRVGFGTAQALDSRYATIALLLPVALVPLGILAFRAWPPGRWSGARTIAGAGGAALLTVLVLKADLRGLHDFASTNQRMVAGRNCLLDVESATDACLQHLYPQPSIVRRLSPQLATLGWSGFGPPEIRRVRTVDLRGADGVRTWRVRLDDGTAGELDEVTLAGDILTARGWASHPQRHLGATQRVLVAVDGTVGGMADIDGIRPDVEAHFRDPTLRRSGWTLRAQVSTAGPYRVRAYLVLGEDLLAPLGGEARLERAK